MGACLNPQALEKVDSDQESLACGSSFRDVMRLHVFSLERFMGVLFHQVSLVTLGSSQNHRNSVMGP